jgi:hypothetical protein
MELIGCIETSVTIQQPTLANIPEDWKPQIHNPISLRSRWIKHIRLRVRNGHIITWCCDVRFLMNKTMMQPTTCTDVKAYDRQSAADSS